MVAFFFLELIIVRLSLNNKHEMLVRLLIYCELYLSKKKKSLFFSIKG